MCQAGCLPLQEAQQLVLRLKPAGSWDLLLPLQSRQQVQSLLLRLLTAGVPMQHWQTAGASTSRQTRQAQQKQQVPSPWRGGSLQVQAALRHWLEQQPKRRLRCPGPSHQCLRARPPARLGSRRPRWPAWQPPQQHPMQPLLQQPHPSQQQRYR